MRAKSWILIQFITISIYSWCLGSFLPDLPLTPGTDILLQEVVRFLATYVYSLSFNQYWWDNLWLWLTAIGIGAYLILKTPQEYADYVKNIIILELIFSFFYWTFIMWHYKSLLTSIGSLLELQLLLRLGILIIIFVSLKLVARTWQKSQSKLKPTIQPSLVHFECPHCHAIYYSNIQYCIKCHTLIGPSSESTSLDKTD